MLIKFNIKKSIGVIPSIVKKESREKYITSLALSQEDGDPTAFIDFMLKHHIENLEKAIAEYKTSIENDTLNFKNDTLNDTLNLSAKESKVLELIKTDNHITITEIIGITGFSRPTVTRAINTLKEYNILERVGAKKNGYWVVKV